METYLLVLVLFVGSGIVLLFGEGVNCNKTDLDDILFAMVQEVDTTGNSSVLIEEYNDGFSTNYSNTDDYKNMSNSSSPALANDLEAKWQALNLSDACRETAERMNLLNKSESDCGGVLIDTEKRFDSLSSPVDCKWLVCNDYGRYFRFVAFYLSKECDKYYFDVCDGCQFNENGSYLEKGTRHKFCGKPFLTELVSSNQIIVVEYKMTRTNPYWHLGLYQLLKHKPDCVHTSYVENGTILSPEYPDSYPAWILCTWEIIAPVGYRINFTKVDFHMLGRLSCAYVDFLQIWDGMYEKYPMITRFDEKNPPPPTFISNSNSVTVSIRPRVCDNAVSRRFKLTWKFTASGCNETLRVSSGVISFPNLRNLNKSELRCNWRIIVNSGSIIRLVVFEFWATTFETFCEEDYVEIADVDGNDTSKVRYSNCRDPPGAIYTTSNEANITLVMSSREYNATAFKLRFETVCRRSLSGYKGTIESINYPNHFPPHLNCKWTINAWNNGSVFINLTHVELNYYYHSLQIFEPGREDSWGEIGCLMDRAKGKTPGTCLSNGKTVIVELKTSNRMYTFGAGFRLEWEIRGCSEIIRSRQGIIQSRGYPNSYPVSDVWEWSIVIEPGSVVQLTIHDWEIENSTHCQFDSLKVFTGPPHESEPTLKLCGSGQYPSALTSQQNRIYIQFYSDDTLTFKGFNASFKQMIAPNSSITCGEEHFGPAGFIFSPNYPNPYNNFDNCRWTITVHHNYLAALKLQKMDIEFQYKCIFDNVTIYYDKEIAKTPNEVLCGKKVSTNYVSSNNVMTVTFQTDYVGVFKGFKSMFYQACGARLYRDHGCIQSPDFLSMMNGADNCNWTIIASASESRVVLLFTDFYWSVADPHCGQHMEVLDESGGNSSVYKGCCNFVPPVSISSGNVVTLRTTNAKDLVFKAFYFTVTEDCLRILRTTRPSIIGAGIVNFLTEEMKLACQQILHATEENKQAVHVQFQLYQPKIHGKFCTTTFVAVHEKGFSEPATNTSCHNKGIPTIGNASNYYWSVYIRLDRTSDTEGLMSTGKNRNANLTSLLFENDLPLSDTAAGNAKLVDVFIFILPLCWSLGLSFMHISTG